ncbi:MAG: DoxX family membrane protein [Chloroflexi bacterium]|nr:DoxX family membrane protein [Chloroflexota bacterium]
MRSDESTRRLLRWIGFGCRLAVGVIFVLAGVTKLANPGSFTATLLAYDVVPVGVIRPLALTLPWLETLVGLYLVVGLFARAAAGVAIGLLMVFSLAIAQAVARGLSLENCGCFGDLTSAVPQLAILLGGASAGPGDIVRDATYALLALVVVVAPPTPLSVDALLASRARARAA